MNPIIELEQRYCAHYYHPLPVVLTKGEGVCVYDDQGNRYLDFMSAYSAVSHGHCHPRLVACLTQQAKTLGIVSRAYYTDKLAKFLQRACEISGYDKGAPMNSGAEAVEVAIKVARKWAYNKKGVAKDQAEIIACKGNFHGRTITVVSMSSEDQYKEGFGPMTPGFKHVPYGDIAALEQAINKNTAAFLVEPIQGEGGIIMPKEGYLKACAKLCKQHNVLLICDEIQTGLGRTGKLFAHQHEDIHPDGLILGKALGGGLIPVSLFLAHDEVMDIFQPGDHGSTFGGYPIGAAVGLEALNIIMEDNYADRSAKLGKLMLDHLMKINKPVIKEVRGKGLFIGIEINPDIASAREICMKLMKLGLLTKETHATVVRLAPPLIISQEQVETALAIIDQVLHEY